MNAETFENIFEKQIQLSRDVLIEKAKEYATEDRLHNFKVAASTLGGTPAQALAGFMAKHTVSIYDMIRSGETFSTAKWDEKITDHMNYLILLRAIVEEESWVQSQSATTSTSS